MKAAIYNPYLDTLGGGERYTVSFAKTLLNKGYGVDMEWKDEKITSKLGARFGMNIKGARVVDSIKRGDGYDLCFGFRMEVSQHLWQERIFFIFNFHLLV